MPKSIKLKNNTYWDTDSIIDKQHKALSSRLSNRQTLNISNTGASLVEDYFLIANLGDNSNGSLSIARISGVCGGWTINTRATIDITISSRSLGAFGVWYGNVTAFNYFDIQLYQDSNNNISVYLHRKNMQWHGTTILDIMYAQCYQIGCNQKSVIPTGTLIKTYDNTNLKQLNA